MKYKYETHAHTSEISPCAFTNASNVVKEYYNEGYDGIILTDHVGGWSFDVMSGNWIDKVNNLKEVFFIAKNTGEKLGINVLFGIELALGYPYRDYLVYGVDFEFLHKHENLYNMNNQDFYNIANENNFLLIAAHPYRYSESTLDERYLHGVEVFNGNIRHNNNNKNALKWAQQHSMLQLSGSDYHEVGDITSGIYLPSNPKTITEFVDILKRNEHKTFCKN